MSDVLLDGFLEEGKSSSISFKTNAKYYVKYWPLFLGSFIAFLVLAYVYIYYAKPTYHVASTIMLRDEVKGAVFLENPVLEELNEFKSSKITDNEIDVIKSGTLLNKVFRDLNMYNLYYAEGSLNKSIALSESDLPFKLTVLEEFNTRSIDPVLLKVKRIEGDRLWCETGDKEVQYSFGQPIQNEFGRFKFDKTTQTTSFDLYPVRIEFYTPEQLSGILGGSLTVEAKDKTSSILYVSLETEAPERGVTIVDGLIEEYNKTAVDEKKQVAINTLSFIDEQLSQVMGELALMEKGVETFKNSKNIVDIENDSKFYQQNAVENTKQIATLQNQLEILRGIQTEVSKQGDFRLGMGQLGNDDPALLSMTEEFGREWATLTRLKASVLPENPLMKNSVARINELKRDIQNHLNNRISALEITIRNLDEVSSTYSYKSRSAPMLEREYEEISRDLGIKKEHYLYLIKKKEETSLYLASVPNSHIRTIDKASFSPVPIAPNKRIIYLLSTLVSFLVPFGFLYTKKQFDDKLVDRSEFDKIPNVGILGEISQVKKDELFVITDHTKTPISEQIRFIRSNFSSKNRSSIPQVILITSSVSGEGKTFFALNFAKSLAMIGKKTAVLEYDLRKHGLKNKLGINGKTGISEYLSGTESSVEEFLDSGAEVNGVTIFQSGEIPTNPAELMISDRNTLLIHHLRERFDCVIIDSAPIGQVADAFSLAPLVDATIYMMRYNWTSRQNVNFFDEMNKEEKLVNPMIVLNGSKPGQGYEYGHYQYN